MLLLLILVVGLLGVGLIYGAEVVTTLRLVALGAGLIVGAVCVVSALVGGLVEWMR
jgi:hypothetical protein